MKGSLFDNFGEDTLGRHNAFADFLLNGTAFVTFLANLGDFLNGFPNLKACAHRKFVEADTFCSQVLGELSRSQIVTFK